MTETTLSDNKKIIHITGQRTAEGKVYIEKQLISDIKLYATGIVSVQNGSAGTGHSAHPNFSVTGSIKGMRKFWGNAKIVRAGSYYYNMSSIVCSDGLDWLALAIERGFIVCKFTKYIPLRKEFQIDLLFKDGNMVGAKWSDEEFPENF